MPKVKFIVEHQVVDTEAGKKLREIAKEAGISVDREFFRGLNCRGLGLCGACKVWVKPSAEGALSPPNLRERIHGMGGQRRLACQCKVVGDIEVTSMPGGDDRLESKRVIAAPPVPAQDPKAVRKPVDEAASIAYPLGHPSKVGKGEAPVPGQGKAGAAAPQADAAKDKPKEKPAEKPAEKPKGAAAEAAKPKDKPADKPAEPTAEAAKPKDKPAEATAGAAAGTAPDAPVAAPAPGSAAEPQAGSKEGGEGGP